MSHYQKDAQIYQKTTQNLTIKIIFLIVTMISIDQWLKLFFKPSSS
jgi:hypothetical protein